MTFLTVGLVLIGLHYWKKKGADWVLIIAGMFLAIGLEQVTLIDHAMRLAYSGFLNLGLGYFMLIVGIVAIAMIWVFDRW
jgi:uncharacterized membrane protein